MIRQKALDSCSRSKTRMILFSDSNKFLELGIIGRKGPHPQICRLADMPDVVVIIIVITTTIIIIVNRCD